jgi:nucleoside-diphosphate-sugar epimerase
MKPQRLTFVYVEDLIRATYLALENPVIRNTSYLVSDGATYSDVEFADMVKRILGKRFVLSFRIPLFLCHLACLLSEWLGQTVGRPMTLNRDKYLLLKQRNWTCDTERTKKELDFIVRYGLEEGLEETIRYGKKHGLL